MKLATTTMDLEGCAATRAQEIRMFEGTGFRLLDLSLYSVNHPGSIFSQDGDGWKAEIHMMGEAAAQIGVSFCQAHAPDGEHFVPGELRDRFIRTVRRSIEACGILGIPQIVVDAGADAALTPSGWMKCNKEFYTGLFDLMEKHGVKVMVENSCEQNSPLCYLRTGTEIMEFLDYTGHPLLRACWDTGHAHMRGMDQYDSIVTLGDRLQGLHIQDNYGDRDSHIAPFFGCCNFDPVLQGLVDIGYTGVFAFEGFSTLRNHDAWPHYRRSWEYGGRSVTTLRDVPAHLKRQVVALMYQTGKYMLERYGCFEY